MTFNTHLDEDGNLVRAELPDCIVLTDVQENPAYRDLRDPYHLTQGAQLGRVHKGMRVIQLIGRILVEDNQPFYQRARMADVANQLRAAFDPAICYRDSPTTDGAYQLQYRQHTFDNYLSRQHDGSPVLVPAGPAALADREVERGGEQGERQDRSGRCRPARLRADRGADAHAHPGSPSGSVINRGNTAAPLKVTYTMSGAGSSAATLTRASVSFILNLSGRSGGDSIVVVHETCAPYGRGRYITLNGIDNSPLKTSAASTWLDVPVGSTTFTLSNTTGISSCVLRWYPARA